MTMEWNDETSERLRALKAKRDAGHRVTADEFRAAIDGPTGIREWHGPSIMRTRPGTATTSSGRSPERTASGAWSATVRLVIASERHCDDGIALSIAGVDASRYSGEVYWAHDPAQVIGRCLAVYDEGDMLIGEVQFDLDTDHGRATYLQHLEGRTVDASVGYGVVTERGGYATAWKLCDISIVPAGAGLDPMAVTPAWRL